MSPVEILIADDHELFRRSLRFLLEGRADWHICGEAADGMEAVEKARSLHPDLILMDVSMPELNGLDATRRIRREMPDSKILIVSQNDITLMSRQARDVGACGAISKARIVPDLIPGMEAALGNGRPKGNDAVAASSREFGLKPNIESEMATLIRKKDWANTPVGPPEGWSPALRMMIDLMLVNRFPILLWWGPEYVQFYNDAYKPIPGIKHPNSLGQRGSECWSEIWHILKPLVDTPFDGGPATWSEDLELEPRRSGFREETHFTVAYSPVPDNTAPRGIGGVLATVHEITGKVVGERRLAILRELAARGTEGRTAEEACVLASQVLSSFPKDVPFSLCYLLDSERKQARLAAASGFGENISSVQSVIDVTDTAENAWPFANVLSDNTMSIVRNISSRFAQVPSGPWSDPPDTAVVVPIPSSKPHVLRGLLVLGVSVRLAFNDEYRTFFQLIAAQLSTAIANAEAYEEERKRAEALAEIDRAKTQFFSNVSHEFRTPLTLMLGPLEDALAERESLPRENRERLEVAHRNSLRLLKLVNTLLDFSRIEAGRVQASYEPTDLAFITTEYASIFRSAIERAGMNLVVECPPLSEPVYIDREMWEKIVLNLLSNAFKFTFEGEIKVRLRAAGSNVELDVCDTGTGIPEQDIPHLFERFYRAQNVRGRSHEGSGIGLALVQELVNLHGGSVRVESKVNKGTTFTVSIPFGKDHLPSDRIGAVRDQASTSVRGEVFLQEALRWLPANETPDVQAAPGKLANEENRTQERRARPRILLADDNADMREYIQRLLSEEYDVIAVADGEAALRKARERRPDLILADVMMPKMNGFALLQAVRTESSLRPVPLVLLSARAGEESRIAGIESGADDYLVKPFSARELLARVKSQIALARTRESSFALHRKLLAETELERERLHELFMQVPAAICLLSGPEHRYVFVNYEYLRITGRSSAEDFLGKTVREALPEFAGQPFFNLLDDVYRKGVPYIGNESRVVLNRDQGAEEVYHNFIYQAVKGADGTVEGILVHVVDVSEQVHARKEAEGRQRADSLLVAIVDSSDDAIISKNLDGIITSWNKSAERMFGYSAEEAIGKSILLIIPPERHEEEAGILARLRKGQRIDHFETVRVRKDGTPLDLSLTISPVRDASGKVIGASKVARDITAQKLTERALRENEQRLRELAETLEADVHARTLELEERNADVLQQSEQLRELSRRLLQAQDEERRRIARELHDSAGQTLTVLGMTLARLAQQAKQNGSGMDAEVNQGVQEAEQIVQQLHQEIRTMSYLLHPPLLDEAGLGPALGWYLDGLRERSDVKITLSIPGDFERLPRDMELVVFRLVQESLTNIHRHSRSKTAAIRIARDSRAVMVEIRDEGKGMSSQKLAEIQSRGSGVGIQGMRERVRQFRGEMLVESNSSGTRILVTMPLAKTKESEPSNQLQPAM